jgi:outer membrane protein TolC
MFYANMSFGAKPLGLGFMLWLILPLNAAAQELSLAEAERLALANDPAIRSVEFKSQALEEMSVAARQLPDPMLKVGVVSLPVDSFDFGQEAMTQAVVGLVQKFPRGESRELRSTQLLQQAEMLDESMLDQRLQITLAVRELYLEVIKQQRRSEINDEAIRIFTDFSDITRDYYATGRVNQQDVLQAVVELAKAEERARQISEEEDRARARLSAWLGDASGLSLGDEWPSLQAPLPLDALYERIKTHPRIMAMQKRVNYSETGVELARQAYRPEFSIDVAYGGRSGQNMDGSSRADLFSLMLVMDLPLFHDKRQDRVTASMIAESTAAMFDRDDLYRRMKSEAELNAVTLSKQQDSIQYFGSSILPEARFSAESSFDAYQSSVGDLTTLLRAQITEIDLRLEYVRIQAEALKSQARLLYFQGENS